MPPEKEDNKGELEQPDNIVSENQQNAIEPNATEPHFTENEGSLAMIIICISNVYNKLCHSMDNAKY